MNICKAMKQVFSFVQEKNELCNVIVNKSNKVKLLAVETPTKSVKSVMCESFAKVNFQLFNYFAKKLKKIKNVVLRKLNNCL